MDKVFKPGPNNVFVFGSNLAGIHGAGAAKTALTKYGADWGVGLGQRGNSYAIPTKDRDLHTLPLRDIKFQVRVFLTWARNHPNTEFFVTRIGCGLAGYTDEQISPMFAEAPSNCDLPMGWR